MKPPELSTLMKNRAVSALFYVRKMTKQFAFTLFSEWIRAWRRFREIKNDRRILSRGRISMHRALGSLPIGGPKFFAIGFPGCRLRNFGAKFHGFWSFYPSQLLFAVRDYIFLR